LAPGIRNEFRAGFALGEAIIHAITIIGGHNESCLGCVRETWRQTNRKQDGEQNKTHKGRDPKLEFSANSSRLIETWLKSGAKIKVFANCEAGLGLTGGSSDGTIRPMKKTSPICICGIITS
jgi:hypothetical protein